jgi:FkbM family methyltransferase
MSFSSLEPGSALHKIHDNCIINNEMLVTCFTLDTICSKLDIVPNNLKIDVDGGEVDVLLGAEKTLKNTSLKSILIEVDANHKIADDKKA